MFTLYIPLNKKSCFCSQTGSATQICSLKFSLQLFKKKILWHPKLLWHISYSEMNIYLSCLKGIYTIQYIRVMYSWSWDKWIFTKVLSLDFRNKINWKYLPYVGQVSCKNVTEIVLHTWLDESLLSSINRLENIWF